MEVWDPDNQASPPWWLAICGLAVAIIGVGLIALAVVTVL